MRHRSPSRLRGLAVALAASALFAVASLPASAHADPKVPEATVLPAKLSLSEAMTIFRARGLDLLIADANVESARADERSAAAIANPLANLGIGKSFGNVCAGAGAGCSSWQYVAGVSDSAAISDLFWGKRSLRKRVAAAATEVAKHNRADAERTVGFAVKQQYVTVALAKAALDFAREVQGASKQSFDLMSVRYDKGAVNEADVARIETQKLEAEQAIDAASQALRLAKVQLAFLLGVRTLVPDFEVDTDVLKYSVPAGLESSSRESLVRSAYQRRPDLRGLVAQQDRAQASIDLEKRLRYPDLTFSLQYSQEGTGSGVIAPPTLLAGVSLPLPVFYQRQGEIAHAEADLKTQVVTRSRIEAQVVNDVETAYASFVSTQTRVQRMEGRLLDRSRRARDLVKIQYEKGAASLLELLDAQRTFINTNSEYLQNLNDYWTAVVQLEQAVGTEYLR